MSLGAQRTVTSRIGERLKGRTRPRCPLSLFLSIRTRHIINRFWFVCPGNELFLRPGGPDARIAETYGPALRSTYFRRRCRRCRRRRRRRSGDAYARKRRNARRFRSDDTIEKMLPLLLAPLSPGPGRTPHRPSRAQVMQTVPLAWKPRYASSTMFGQLLGLRETRSTYT